MIAGWAERAHVYPDALREKIIREHLSALDADFAPHIFRRDFMLLYRKLADAQYNLIAVLFALNTCYRPSPKRLHDLLAELTIKPDDLYERLNAMFSSANLAADFDELAEEVFALVEQQVPAVNIAAVRVNFSTRRNPFDEPPAALNLYPN